VTSVGCANVARSSGCSELMHWPGNPAEKKDRSIRYRVNALPPTDTSDDGSHADDGGD
jgi:hypothetical protein